MGKSKPTARVIYGVGVGCYTTSLVNGDSRWWLAYAVFGFVALWYGAIKGWEED